MLLLLRDGGNRRATNIERLCDLRKEDRFRQQDRVAQLSRPGSNIVSVRMKMPRAQWIDGPCRVLVDKIGNRLLG